MYPARRRREWGRAGKCMGSLFDGQRGRRFGGQIEAGHVRDSLSVSVFLCGALAVIVLIRSPRCHGRP